MANDQIASAAREIFMSDEPGPDEIAAILRRHSGSEVVSMVGGRQPRLRQCHSGGGSAWIIDDGDCRGDRLCGDGQWRSYYKVRNIDVCSWPTREAAIAFLAAQTKATN